MPKPAKWGRTETIIWPPHKPIYTYGAIFLAFIATGFFLYLRFANGLTPLQQFYVPYYLRTEVAGAMHKAGKYQLLMVAGGSAGVRAVTEDDVQPGRTPTTNGKSLPLELTPTARAAGIQTLYRNDPVSYVNKALHEYLKHYVFADQELFPIFRLPLLFGFIALVLQLPFSIRKDIRRRKQMKYGRRLRGPLMVEPKDYNRTVMGDGSAVQILGDQSLRIIARELVENVRKNVSLDWTQRENVQAKLRVIVKRILKKHGYPPDLQERATQTVLQQAEVLSEGWATSS